MSKPEDCEIYPNSPLSEVVCEIRFPGDMEIECSRDVFWKKIRNDFPDILVPRGIGNNPLALQHYRFNDPEKNRYVGVALNSLVYSEREYSGHESFIKEFCRIADIFKGCFTGLNQIKRIGWRYINIIPFTRNEGTVPVSQFLKASTLLPKKVLESPKNFDVSIESAEDKGTVIIHLATIERNDSQEAIFLDIDFGCEDKDLQFSDFCHHIKYARQHNREIFEGLITDNYRQYLRGETL